MGSLTALLVFACFSYPFSVLPFSIVFVFLLAMTTPYPPEGGVRNGELRILGVKNEKAKHRFSTFSFYLLAFSLIITAFCLWKQYPKYEAYKQWNRQRMYYQTGMYKETVEKYEPLYPLLNDQVKFLFEYGRSLSQAGIDDAQGIPRQARDDSKQARDDRKQVRNDRLIKSNEVLKRAMQISCDPMLYNIMGRNYQALGEYNLAEEYLLKSAHIVPNRLYPYYLLMKLYVETGDEEKAREAAGIVLTKEPKVQSTAVREMREEAGKLKTKN